MVEYRRPFIIPHGALGYAKETLAIAGALLNARDLDAFGFIDRATQSTHLTAADQQQFAEIRAACHHILVLNQVPPAGWHSHKEPFWDEVTPPPYGAPR